MASSSNTGISNKSQNSIQNWHESFSLLDDDDGFQDEDLPPSSRRENNCSFVDFLFEAPTTSNNHNSHALNANHASTRSNNNNSNNSNSLRWGQDGDDGSGAFSPVGDQFLSPASLSDSFIQRSYPQTSVLSHDQEIQEEDLLLDGLHTGTQSHTPKSNNNSIRSTHTGSMGKHPSQSKHSKRCKPRRHKSREQEAPSATTNATVTTSATNRNNDSLRATPHSDTAKGAAATVTAAENRTATTNPDPPTRSTAAPVQVSAAAVAGDAPATATPQQTATGSTSGNNGSLEMSMNLSQIFDPELQRLENTMPPPQPKSKDKLKSVGKSNPGQARQTPTSPPLPATTTSWATSQPATNPSAAGAIAAVKRTVPTAATGVAVLRATSEAIADTKAAAVKRASTASTTAAAAAIAAPTSKKEFQADQLQRQHEQWQQSMATDFVAEMQQETIKNKDTTNDTGDAGALDNKSKNNDLSETVHTRSQDDDEEQKDDTHSQMSDSYHDEGPDKRDSAEVHEEKARKSLLYAMLSSLGIIALAMLINKCCLCFQRNDDLERAAGDLAGDAAAANSNNLGAAAGGGNGGSGGNPPPSQQTVVQQMAVAASQNAAASTAQGANAMAATSSPAAAGGGSMVTVGVLAGVLGAGAVATGIAVIATRGSNLAGIPWQCDAAIEPTLYKGHVVLYLEGLNDTMWLTDKVQRQQLEQSFAEIYNRVSGQCQGTYQRVLMSATLDVNDWEQSDTYFRTHWSASVLCNEECPELEPLFYIPADEYDRASADLYGGSSTWTPLAPAAAATATTRSGLLHVPTIDKNSLTRRLQLQQQGSDQRAWFLLAFATNLTQALTKVVHGANATKPDAVTVFDGFTLSPIDGELVERIGSPDLDSPLSDINVTEDIFDLMGVGSSQRPAYDEAVPVCPITPTQTTEAGNVNMMIENLDCSTLLEGDALPQMEDLFRAVFNRVGNGCAGSFQRVSQNAVLINCVPMMVTDFVRGEILYADTNWTSEVLCDGCKDPEPLFLQYYKRRLRRHLQDAVFLKQFVANMTSEMNDLLGNGADLIDAFYGATISTITPNVVIESTGQRISGGIPVAEDFDWVNPKVLNPTGSNGENGSSTEGQEPASNNIFDQTNSSSAQNSTAGETIDGNTPPCATSNGESFSYEKGRVNLMIENVPSDLLDVADKNNIKLMEAVFKDAYNAVSGMCEGDFQRIVHNATLLTWSFAERGDGAPYIDTKWMVNVSCSGCNPKEPLFLKSSGRDSVSSSRRLQMELNSLLGKFSTRFSSDFDGAVKQVLLAEDPEAEGPTRMTVFYIESLSSDGSQSMESTGYHPQFYLNIGGGVARPVRPERPQGGLSSGFESNPATKWNSTELVTACLKDLVIADSNYNNMLEKQEYVKYVHRYAQQIFPTIDMQHLQRDFPSFDSLPSDLQENFNMFSAGGTIHIYGDKKQTGVQIEQEHFLQNFCNGTADLIWFDGTYTNYPAIEPTLSPTISASPSMAPTASEVGGGVVVTFPPVSASTTAPTPAPTPLVMVTATPSSPNATDAGFTNATSNATATPAATSFPTLANITSSPTAAPTEPKSTVLPTVTITVTPPPLSVHAMLYKIKFYINYEGYVDREPTPDEYDGLRASLEDYFFQLIDSHYKTLIGYNLTGHNLTLVQKDYIPNPTVDRYTHCLYFVSDFTFAGADPPAKEVFDVFHNMSLQTLTDEAVWTAEPKEGIFYATSGILWTTDADYGKGNTTQTRRASDTLRDVKGRG